MKKSKANTLITKKEVITVTGVKRASLIVLEVARRAMTARGTLKARVKKKKKERRNNLLNTDFMFLVSPKTSLMPTCVKFSNLMERLSKHMLLLIPKAV